MFFSHSSQLAILETPNEICLVDLNLIENENKNRNSRVTRDHIGVG